MTAGTKAFAPLTSVPARHFERSTVLLLANTAATGVLGTGFWLVAARWAPEEDVATAVAASSLLIALSFVAQCNLPTALSRFLPQAGEAQRGLVRRSYAIATGVGTMFGLAVVGVGVVRDGGVVDGGDLALTLALAISIPVWVVFAMQDAVLIAARRTGVVPVENIASSVAKYALLPVFLGLGGAGILLAWTVPALVAIPFVTLLVFRRYLQAGSVPHPEGYRFLRYALQDLPGAALYLLSFRLVPLLVLETGDVVDGAHIGLPWTILTVAALALPMVSRALLAELSHDDTDVDALMRRANRIILLVLAPATLVGAALVGPVLSLAGEAYEARGSRVLAAGIVGLAPAAIVECQLALLRYRDRVLLSGSYQAGRALALLGSVSVLLALNRVEDIGIAFLAVNLVAAAGAVALARGGTERSGEPTVGHDSPDGQRGRWWALVPGGIGVVLAAVAILRADLDAVGQYGLIQAVGPLHVAGTALVMVGACCVLGSGRWARRWAYVHVGAVIMLLHGLPGLVERHPRFGVAWLHSGFVRHIATDGTLLPQIDARFGWPGFFAGNALVQQLTGTDDVLWMVRFAPVVLSAFACVCIHLIGRVLGGGVTVRILAMLVFLVANWSGQDYFAPQATGFSLYLILMVVLLTLFRSSPPERDSWRGRLLRAGSENYSSGADVKAVGMQARLAILTGCAVLGCVLVLTHQLTPGFLAAVLLLLSVTDVLRIRALPWIVALATVTWLAYGAETYWRGHLGKLTGSVGDTSTLVEDNISGRTSGAVAARQTILYSRIGVALVIWIGVALVVVWAWRKGRTPLALACMFAGPFPLFLVQPYGGEMLIRVFFFTIPAAALILAGAVGADRLRSLAWRLGTGAVLAAAVPAFLLARFGNEEYELVRDEDVAIVDAVVEIVPDESFVFVANRQTLLSTDRVGEVRYRSLGAEEPDDVVEELDENGIERSFVLLTRTQQAYWEQTRGYPPGWVDDYAEDLVATGRFTVLAREGTSWLLRFDRAAGESP